MKNFPLLSLLFLCAVAVTLPFCTLDPEPDIPTGANNISDPVFLNAEVSTDTNDNFLAKAWLNAPGNLKILHHGWVWSETPAPTLPDNHRDSGRLAVNTFTFKISSLELGKIYYLRPFVSTGSETFYGPELCSFLGVNFDINTDTEIFQGADVQFTNTTVGNCSDCTYSWNFGDGNATTATSPLHTFNTKGNFIVRLSATKSGCTVTRDMVLNVVDDPFQDYWADITGGTFTMGCTSDQEPCFMVPDSANEVEAIEIPAHPVTVNSFFIGKTEVTQRQWIAVMGSNPSYWKQCGLDCPVESMTWSTIVNEFIPALKRKTGRNNRLPTEAEWEYAARGGQSFKYSGSDSLELAGWYDIPNSDGTHPVAQKVENGYKLYDMTGNVWEWVEDDFHVDYVGAPANGSAWTENPRVAKRMARGGAWDSGPARSRISFRNEGTTGDRDDSWGFRLARSK